MSVIQRILVQILPAVLLLFLVVPGPAQPPGTVSKITSHWWYPLGNAGATRQNNVPTASQNPQDLQIKWRTDRLKNSPVLLVGAIRTPENEFYQQIVGMEDGTDEVVIIGHNGFFETSFNVPQQTVLSIKLTGLFDTAAPTVNATNRPNVIGIGVEQTVDNPSANPFGLLVDGNGTTVYRMGLRKSDITKIAAYNSQQNQIVSILPVAVYKPADATTARGIGIVTQDRFVRNETTVGQVDQMINSVRRYSMVRGGQNAFVDTIGLPHFLAPRLYERQPGLFANRDDSIFLSLSTRRYSNFNPAIQLETGGGFQPTLSNAPTPFPFRMTLATGPNILPDRIVDERRSVESADASHSFYTRMMLKQAGGTVIDTAVRLYTAIRPTTDTVAHRIQLTPTNQQGTLVNFEAPSNKVQQGWSVVAADVDGSAPGFPDVTDRQILVNNQGTEILASALPEGSDLGDGNWLYVFRWNQAAPINNLSFNYFTRQVVHGRVVASGDLVSDNQGRQEVLLAHGDTLFLLQMKPYSRADDFQNPVEEENAPFTYLDTFALDDEIVSVAIADIEGDGNNDIIASTKSSTYAIGMLQPDPYPIAEDPFNLEYCAKDSLTVTWSRNIGGENAELEAIVIGPGTPMTYRGSLANDSMRFALSDLEPKPEPGQYRVVIRNAEFPHISDTSSAFTVSPGSLSSLSFQRGTPYASGSVMRDTLSLYCLDTFRLQQKIGDGDWSDVQDTIVRIDEDRARIAVPLPCPETTGCGTGEDQEISFRLVSEAGVSEERSLLVRTGRANLQITPDDNSLARQRAVQWSADDFPCSSLTFMLSNDDGKNWTFIGNINTRAEVFNFIVPDHFSRDILVCVQCSDAKECIYGLSEFTAGDIVLENYIYPNPFDPAAPGPGGNGAEIVYALEKPGSVSITIYDASRTVVRELIRSESRESGLNRGDSWDGKNSLGENVANGSYICVILSDTGEQIILPLVIIKRQ